ncbi:MAG: isocitrate/isopropylmalate family dehydrogenase, partial [Bacteroidota bacterium]
ANPTAMLQSAILMLRHLKMPEVAARIEKALFATLSNPSKVTSDMCGESNTDQFAKNVIENLEKVGA